MSIPCSAIFLVPKGTGFAFSIAMCDLGDTVLGGSNLVSSPVNITSVGDFPLENQSGWEALVNGAATPGANVNIQSVAQCFDNPPLRS